MAPHISTKNDQPQKIMLNISGQHFVTTPETLLKYPDTRLGKLAADKDTANRMHFIESDPEIFKEILKFYWTGKLHTPKNVCFEDFLGHLEFWEINLEHVADCCLSDMKEEAVLKRQFDYFDRRIRPNETELRDSCCTSFCYSLWCLMTDPGGPDTRYRVASKIWTVIYLVMTLSSGLMYGCTTLPSFWEFDANITTNLSLSSPLRQVATCEEYFSVRRQPKVLLIVDLTSTFTIFFLLEIIIRFSCCPCKKKFWMSVNALDALIVMFEVSSAAYFMYLRIVIARNMWTYETGEVDKFCWTALHLENTHVFVGQLRLFRLLSYATVYDGLKVLLVTLYRSWKEILLLVILLIMAVLIFAPCVFLFTANRYTNTSPNAINSIPKAYWFVLVTMTTVGYGDVYPTDIGGYLATAMVMVIGLMVTALPVAIIGGNFSIVYEYNHKRNNQKGDDSKYMEKVSDYLNQSKTNKDIKLSVTSVRPFEEQ